jgi:hypothetical protein
MRRTKPADSAMKMAVEGEKGSGTAARILDFMAMGSPFLLLDLRALRSLSALEALRCLSVEAAGKYWLGDSLCLEEGVSV